MPLISLPACFALPDPGTLVLLFAGISLASGYGSKTRGKNRTKKKQKTLNYFPFPKGLEFNYQPTFASWAIQGKQSCSFEVFQVAKSPGVMWPAVKHMQNCLHVSLWGWDVWVPGCGLNTAISLRNRKPKLFPLGTVSLQSQAAQRGFLTVLMSRPRNDKVFKTMRSIFFNKQVQLIIIQYCRQSEVREICLALQKENKRTELMYSWKELCKQHYCLDNSKQNAWQKTGLRMSHTHSLICLHLRWLGRNKHKYSCKQACRCPQECKATNSKKWMQNTRKNCTQKQ